MTFELPKEGVIELERMDFSSQKVKTRSILRLVQFILTKPYLLKDYQRDPVEFFFLQEACNFLGRLGGNYKESYGDITEATCELFAIQKGSSELYLEGLKKLGCEKFLKAVMSYKEFRSYQEDDNALQVEDVVVIRFPSKKHLQCRS